MERKFFMIASRPIEAEDGLEAVTLDEKFIVYLEEKIGGDK